MTHILSTAREMAAKTPAERNRVVDLVRVVSILIVIVGHWLMAAVLIENGEISAPHVLEEFPITRPLTWLLQVMPLFFFVGGYSNALSWRSARRKGESYAAWLRTRLRRLTLPVVPLLAVWGVIGFVALQAGFEADLVRMASIVALGPTWFLAAYVLIVVLAPSALILWERLGWVSIAAGFAFAAAIDIVSIGLGIEPLGFVNHIFVWATVHQLGYAWVDRKTEANWIRPAMAVGGFLAVLALVWFGPYPVEMVGFSSDGVSNSLPPRLTLAFLGMFQAALVLLVEKQLSALTAGLNAWTAVVLVSGQIMTLYLWHLSAMIILLAVGLGLSGFGFGIEPFTAMWWMTRPIWLAALTAVTAGLVLAFGRFERPRRDSRPAPKAWRPIVAALMICAGLGSLALNGMADADGVHGLVLALPVLGMVIGGVMGATAFDRFNRA